MQETPLREPDTLSLLGAYVQQKIRQLTQSQNQSAVRASLAQLRRGIGKPPGSLPELWGEMFSGMQDSLAGVGDQPSRAEWAVYLCLTLFALHQQSKDLSKQAMHQPQNRLGLAVRQLIKSPEEEERVKRRFDQVVTADSPEELSHHLRGLIQLLRSKDIPLDYAALAKDLYLMQIPEAKDGVRLRWGRDYYAITYQKANKESQPIDEESTKGEDKNEE